MVDWWTSRVGLYAIVDPEHCAGREPTQVAKEILRGGCAVLQLRSKTYTDGQYIELARKLRSLCTAQSTPFVVNDRADIAKLVRADGLHLGQNDLPTNAARRVVGSMCLGRSTHDVEQAQSAIADGVNMIGFGPVFQTHTKVNPDPSVGLEELQKVVTSSKIPVVAIGGIGLENIASVSAAGPQFIAMISAVGLAPSPEAAARELQNRILLG